MSSSVHVQVRLAVEIVGADLVRTWSSPVRYWALPDDHAPPSRSPASTSTGEDQVRHQIGTDISTASGTWT